MQDGLTNIQPNTRFEDLLNQADFGRLASLQNSDAPVNSVPQTKEEALNYLNSSLSSVGKTRESSLLPTQIDPSSINISGRFSKQMLGWDNEDLYGKMQSWGDKAFNGLVKGLSLMTTTFLQGTVGLVVGLGNLIEGNGANSFYNNQFSNLIQDFNNKTENWLPNYYTKQERDADWYSPNKFFTANFLFDKFIKNIGFSVGAIYSGSVITKALKLIPLINNAFTAGKATKALLEIESKLLAVPALERTAEMANILRKTSDALTTAKKFGTGLERAVISTLGAATEGGIESLQGLNEYRNSTIQAYTEEFGTAPTGDALQKINDNAENLGDARFIMNMGLLTATNYVMLPKILSSSYKSSKAIANSEINNVVRNSQGELVTAFSQLPRAGKLLSKTKNLGNLLFSPTEGFEEISQYAIQLGVQDYYNKAYRGEGRDWVNSISSAYVDAVNSNEGMEQFLIGALSGGIQQSGIVSSKGFGKSGNIKERGWAGQGGEKGRNTQEFLSGEKSTKNAFTFKSEAWLKDMQAATARGINLQEEGEALIRQGDVLESKDNEMDYMHNYLSVRIKHGRYDLVKEDISNFQQQASTEQGLDELKKQNIANENDTTATFLKRLTNFERHADNVNSLYNSLNLAYSGMKNRETGERVYSDDVIDKMVYAASKVADYDQRIPELSQSLLSNGITLQTALEGVFTETPSEAPIKEALVQIDKLSILDDKKEELKQSLMDVLEISVRRLHFLQEYKSLKNTPESFQEAKTAKPTATQKEEKSTIKLKTKDGDEDVEIGVEYYLGKIVEHDKQGNEVYRFPSITIIGENEDGTIKIKASNGSVKDISKEALADYKLGKVEDLKNNKKAKFYFDHINDVFEFNFGKGKKKRGRLQYSPKGKILNFVYKDDKGKIRTIEVTGDQFIPKKGYNQPLIKNTGTLTPAQQKSLEEFTEEKDTRSAEKLANRMAIVIELTNEAYDNLDSINKKLDTKKSELESVQKSLKEIEERIQKGGLTKKQNFKATTKNAIRQAIILSNMRDVISSEIQSLENERDEVEFNISYFEDLGQNLDILPEDSREFLEELNDQVLDLEILHEATGKQINSLNAILKNVEKALKDSVDFAFDLIQKFEKKYPGIPVAPTALRQFLNDDLEGRTLRATPYYQTYIEVHPNLMADLREFDRELADIDELDVIPNERSLKELNDNIDVINKQLVDYEKEIKAKEAILNKFLEKAKEYKETEIQKDVILKDKVLQEKFFGEQKETENESGEPTASPEEQASEGEKSVEEREAPLKPIQILFSATTAPPNSATNFDVRHNQFLNVVDQLPNRGNIRRVFVTAKNEKAFGLEGIIEDYLDGYVPKEGETPILSLYVEQTPEGQHFINEKGERTGVVGKDKPPFTTIVYATMPSTSLENTFGKRYSKGDEKEAKAYQAAWVAKRKEILALTDGTITEEFFVSRGRPEKTVDRNTVVGTLITEEQLNKPVVFVSTTGEIEHQGKNIPVPQGFVILKNGSTFEYLNNRNLTEQETNNVYSVLKEFVRKANDERTFDSSLTKYLQGILYFQSPYAKDENGEIVKSEALIARNQFYLHNGYLYFGQNEIAIPFTTASIDARKIEIMAFLKGVYNNVNNTFLKNSILSTSPFTEFIANKQGELTTKEWPTYQHYLLSNEGRTVDEIPLYTNIRSINSKIGGDVNFQGKYSYSNTLIDEKESTPVEEAPKPKPIEKKPVATSAKKGVDEPATGDESPMKDFMFAGYARNKEKTGESITEAWLVRFDETGILPANYIDFLNSQTSLTDLEKATLTRANKLVNEGKKEEPKEETPKPEKKSLKDLKKNNPDNPESQFRIVSTYNYVTADVEAEKAYIEKNSPFPVKTLDTLIKAGNGVFAFGSYQNKAIELSKAMEVGTGYHELFHGIFDVFTSPEEKAKIRAEFKDRAGYFIDRITGRQIEYKETTNFELEEQLAEEYRDYVLYKKAPASPKKGNSILELFKRLFDFINSLFSGDVVNISHLFDRIDGAYYKNVPFRDVSSGERMLSRKIGTLDVKDTDTVVKNVVSRVFQTLFQHGDIKTINELDFSKFEATDVYNQIYKQLEDYYTTTLWNQLKEQGFTEEEVDTTLSPVYYSIRDNWKQVVDYSGELLKTFKILQNIDVENLEGEESEYASRSEDSYAINPFTYDGKKNAPASIKLLIATIQESVFEAVSNVTKIGESAPVNTIMAVKDGSTGLAKMVNYAKTFNHLLANLTTFNTLKEKENKIKEMAKTFPNYVRLFNRLKIDKDSLSMDDWALKVKLYSVLSKQRPIALINYVQPDGTTTIGEANITDAKDHLKDSWLAQLKTNKQLIAYNDVSQQFTLDGSSLTKNTSTPQYQYKLLSQLGITFSPEQRANITEEQQKQIASATSSLRDTLSGKTVNATSLKTLGVNGPLNRIFEIYIKTEGYEPESTYTGLTGEQLQEFLQTNAVSRMLNDVNTAASKKELFQLLPHLNTKYSNDSYYINKLLFNQEGAKQGPLLQIKYVQGTKYLATDEEIETEKLSKAHRLLQQINQNLNENYYIMVPADSKTEWMVGMRNVFQSLTPEALKQFYSFYQKEQSLGGSSKRLFNFLDDKLTEGKFNAAFIKFVSDETEKAFQELTEYNIITSNKKEKYTFDGLDDNYAKREKLSHTNLSIEQVKNILSFRTVNFVFNTIEQTKILFGDPLEYNEPTRRFKSFLSPREASLYDTQEFDYQANKEFNTVDGVFLIQGDPGYEHYDNVIKTVTLHDTLSYLNLPGYDDSNGADAQGIAHLAAYKQLRIKNGYRWGQKDERQFQFLMAQDRLFMEEDQLYTYRSDRLKRHDVNLVKKGNPNSSKFSPLKPIVSGFTKSGPILDKYSISQITYASVRGRNLASQYKRMLDNGISYVIFESGRKVGGPNKESFYNKDGSQNTAPYAANSIIDVPFKWFGIQVETGGIKFSQTLGSQFAKLGTLNLLNAGLPIDYKGDYDQWYALSEEQKLKASPIYTLITKERSLREAMIENGYQSLLKRVGISDDGTVNKNKLLSLITDELTKRDLNDNLRDALKINPETEDFEIPLEALNNYEQIKSIIYSYVDKYIASPKVNGGPKIQVSGTGWEVGGREIKVAKTKSGKTIYVSSGLKFYTEEDRYMEVLLPHWFGRQLREAGVDITDPEIFATIPKEILVGIGFRIPTQELNSAEVFRIAGFLPEHMGDMVVLPEAITTKTGGDFDVDKLNTYLKNIYLDDKGNIQLVPFYGIDEEAKNQLKKLAKFTIAAKSVKEDSNAIENLTESDLEDPDTTPLDKLFTQSIENEYFATLEKILTLPENFDRLITPNHSDGLKEMRDILEAINNEEFGQGDVKSLLSPSYMNNIRHTYLVGKGGIGIAAVNQTNTAVSQKSMVVIDVDKIASLTDENERKYLGNGLIRLPANTLKFKGKTYNTISAIKDKSNKYISDKISQYINGFVDISKDPFLSQIGVNRNNAATYLLLEKLGVPMDVVVLFMNQPIVREYQKLLSKNGLSYPLNSQQITIIRQQFGIKEDNKGNLITPESILPNPNNIKSTHGTLKGFIQKYYGDNKKLDGREEIEFQNFILNEYLKYSVMASNLFRLTQASNYDTANFSNPSLILRKSIKQRDAVKNNIFSSVDTMLNSTFIGKLAETIKKASNKLSNSFFKFLEDDTFSYISPIINEIGDRKRLNDTDFVKIARKVEQSFIIYLSQNALSLNNQISSLLINEKTSAVEELRRVKELVKKHPNSPLANNTILTNLTTEDINSPTSTKIVKLFNKANDVFSQNLNISSLEELKDNPITRELYGKILRASFLQSGIAQSPISWTDIIPNKDYREFILPAIKALSDETLLDGFILTDSFYRNSWKDPNIVPRIYRKFNDFQQVTNAFAHPALTQLAKAKNINGFQAWKLSTKAKQYGSKFITIQLGEKNSRITHLLRRVDDDNGNPFLQYYNQQAHNGQYAIYAPVNAWGDGYKLQEHYDTIRQSQANNGTFKPTNELDNVEIINALNGQLAPQPKTTFEQLKNQLPKKDCN